ncbi:MAG: AAA family ATPase [Bacteroidales bacterium]|nr:AAA family ATPase [Bacteroidales bacterium]
MQISNIKIENFKGIENYSLEDVKQCVAIVGSNGKGKSSILQAVRAIITGNTPPTPVRSGADKAIVSANICGENIERRFGSKNTVKFNGKTTTQKSVEQFLEAITNVTSDTMEIATSSNILAAMSAGNLSNYLVTNGLIPAVISIDDLLSLCTVSPDAEKRLRALLPESPATFTMDDVEELYNKLYSERTTIKQNIKVLKVSSQYEGTPPSRTLESIEKELQKFVVYDNECETYKQLLKVYNDSVEKRKVALERLAAVEEKIKNLPKVSVDPNELTLFKAAKKKIEEEILVIKETEVTLKANIAIFKKTLNNLNSTVCPISERLVCSTDKSAAKTEITELLDKNISELDKNCNRLTALNERLESIEKKIDDYNEREDICNKLTSLYDQRKNIKDNMPLLTTAPTKPNEIVDADAEKAKLLNEKEECIKYKNALDAEKKLDYHEKLLSLYNELLEVLSPKSGIREAVVEIALSPLVEHCNKRASDLRLNFKVGLTSNNGVHIVCCPNDALFKELLPLNAVSAGEQACALFLVMDALNALTKFGVLILDDLDKLDKNALDGFFSLLSKPGVRKEYNHILIAMVDHEDSLDVVNKYFNNGTINDIIRL